MTRSYSELATLRTLDERYEYLAMRGGVGDETFGNERFLNQRFYSTTEWRHIRLYVIARDESCDLGVVGFEIFGRIYIHHMNPITPEQIHRRDPALLDPEFLISTTHRTHNAIHYGDESQLPRGPINRTPGDTKLW